MKNLVIIGGMGNGTVVASTVEDINKVKKEWEIIGFLNDYETEPINGYPVIGKINYITAQKLLENSNTYFIWTLTSTKLNFKFLHRLTELQIPLKRFATIIHPTTTISKFAKIGYGVNIQPYVSVGPNVIIGNHVSIFAQALIGHNSTLDNHSYIANNACVGAHVHLREGAYLGTNCCLIENITIGDWALVGMGAVVLTDIPTHTKVVGNPARIIGRIE